MSPISLHEFAVISIVAIAIWAIVLWSFKDDA